MSLEQLIDHIQTQSYRQIQENRETILDELKLLGIREEDREEWLQKIYKIILITTHPKTRESYLRSYFRIYQNGINKDGRGGSIIIEITKKCNKNCRHCYSKYAGDAPEMSDETLSRIVDFAKKHFKHIFITGGEPTLDRRILTLPQENPDVVFFFFTNASTIDDAFAQKLASLGNLIPMIGIDGDSASAHNAFRGEGSYEEVLRAISALTTHNVPWGCITLVTETNADQVLTWEFVDDKIQKGAFLLRYLEYTPVGPHPLVDLILSGETYYKMEKWKKEIIQSQKIYMQETAQKKCQGLLFFAVDGFIKNCFSFHYAKYNASSSDIGASIDGVRSDWVSHDWEGECPLYSDPIGFKNHLEHIGWTHRSTLEEPYLIDPAIAQKLQQNYKRFLELVAEKGL